MNDAEAAAREITKGLVSDPALHGAVALRWLADYRRAGKEPWQERWHRLPWREARARCRGAWNVVEGLKEAGDERWQRAAMTLLMWERIDLSRPWTSHRGRGVFVTPAIVAQVREVLR